MRTSLNRLTSLCLACLTAPAVAASTDAPGLLWPNHKQVSLITITNGPTWQLNALADVELPEGMSAQAHDAGMRIVELDDAGRPLARVPIQVQRDGKTTRLWLAMPGATRPGATRRFLVFADGPERVASDQDEQAPAQRSFDSLALQTTDDRIQIGNQFYQLDHPRHGAGGFPSSITFTHSGLSTADFYFEDRLYDAASKAAYVLRADRQSRATVICTGPLRTVVKVEAHYRRGDDATKGKARAIYLYDYRAGSPLVAVSADVVQDATEPWTELHFLQLSTRGTSFASWLAGDGLAGRFTGTKKVQPVHRWGVMTNGADAIGLFSTRDLLHYDDPHGYCNYFQFPVPQWQTKTHRFNGWIYVGPDQPHRLMDQWSQRLANPPKTTVRPLNALQTLRAKLAKLPEQADGGIQARYERALCLHLLSRNPVTLEQADVDRVTQTVNVFATPKPDARTCLGQKDNPDAVAQRVGDALWLGNRLAMYRLNLADGGKIEQILDLTHGRDFVGPKQKPDVPLWRIKLRRQDGKEFSIDSRIAGKPLPKMQFANEGNVTVELTWPPCPVPDCQGSIAPRIVLTLGPKEPTLSARLSIDNQLTDAGPWEIQFPIIAPLGRPGRIDVAVPRGNWGLLTTALAGGTGGHYPSGNWPMQYLSVTDGPSTLYLADHHPRCRTKNFALQAGGEFRFIIPPPDMGKPGADFVMDSDVVVGPIVGDWLDAARYYRCWALRQEWMKRGPLRQREDIPKKLRDGLTWLLLSGTPEEVVPKVIAAQDFLGVPIGVHWYNWHKIPFDDDYPHYKPTKPGVPEAVAKLKSRGVYVMPYINGRLWDSDTPDFESVARPACTKDVAGKPYVEMYGSGQKLVPMCPTTDVWQNKVCEIIDWLVNDVGVNAVYLDQIAAAGPRLCMDATHGHPLGGGSWWCPAYWTLMDKVQAIGAKKSPDVFFTTENNAECYSRNIDAFLVWNPRRPDMIPVNAAVYGGMRVHFANRVEPADTDMAFAMKVGRDFLWGTQLGWMAPFYLEPAHKNKGVYFRRLAQARMTANKFLAYGQMLRPPDIDCDATVTAEWFGQSKVEHTVTWPAIGGACWKAPDGRVGFIFTNYDTEPHRFSFRPSKEAAELMDRDPVWCELTDQGLLRASDLPSETRKSKGTVKRLSWPLIRAQSDGSVHVQVLQARSVLVLAPIPSHSVAKLTTEPSDASKQRISMTGYMLVAERNCRADLTLPPSGTPAGEPVSGTLRVRIPPRQSGEWTVRLVLPSGYAVEPAPSFSVRSLKPGQQPIDVLIYPPPDAAPGDLPIDVEIMRRLDRENLRIAPPRKKAAVPRIGSTIKIDGRLDDWGPAGRFALDGRQGNRVKNWSGPNDLSADVRLCHDGTDLFMGIEVRDDKHVQSQRGFSIWQGDAIQLAFQPNPSLENDYAHQVVEYGLALTPQGPYVHEWQPADRQADNVRLAAMTGNAGVTYEAAIPLASIHRDALRTIGFSMTVNECDKEGVFDGWLEWTPGVCGDKSVASLGRLELGD
ncbi:MAG: hypothetical protein JXQ73_16675 [Phycisphaerae bacterium]|nr:hypothetical protein [Phycisphaerae bacterium]